MSGADEDGLVYPNPGTGKTWTDPLGRIWERRGVSWLDGKRTRTLLRKDGVTLGTWWAGEVSFHETAEAKQAASADLHEAAERPEDIVASEWKMLDGAVLLLLEHHC